jgi:hypothetical protein
VGWQVGQVLVLGAIGCLIAGGATYLVLVRPESLFVRPEQRPSATAWNGTAGPAGMAKWAAGPPTAATESPAPADAAPESPSLATDPALAVLDCDRTGVWPRPDAAAAAVAALDLLGVAPVTDPAGTAATGWVAPGTAVGAEETPPAAASVDRPEDGPAAESLMEDGPAEDDARDDGLTESVPEPRRPADDMQAQGGGPVERPLQIPVQAGPRDSSTRPDGGGRS